MPAYKVGDRTLLGVIQKVEQTNADKHAFYFIDDAESCLWLTEDQVSKIILKPSRQVVTVSISSQD